MYRNKKFYLVMLKGRDRGWAYEYITENLKRPSFIHEARNAYDAYRDVYGIDFASPEEMRAVSDREKIAQLEAALEAERIKNKQDARKTAASGQSELDPPPDSQNDAGDDGGDSDKKSPLTKEQFTEKFISEHGADDPLKRGREWKKYKKENGIVE